MRINKSLITFTPTSGSGSGTVTSVAMTVPGGVFTVTGTPITTSGTFTVGLVNQLANTVWCGPASGAESVPTFRELVSDDIPNLSTSKLTSGTLGVPRGGTGAVTLTGVLFGNGTGAFTGIASTTANQLLRVNSAGTAYEWFTPDYLSNVMTSLGDMIYGNAIGLPVRRSGNTTTTKMYLSQTGDGTNSDAPQWSAIAVGEVTGAVSALTGEVSTTGSGSLNVTLGTTAITGKLLTGLSVTSGAITSSDSILSAFGKVQGQINGLAGGSTYKGSWNASTNTPTIVSGTGTTGDYYIVAVAGSTTIDGVSSWDIGDWIIFSGTVWQKIDNTDSVISVNGQVGSVVLTTANISENTNLYYTDTRARNAISLTTTGASGAATYSSGVLNIPNYTLSGLGGISGSGTTNRIPKFTSATSIGDSLIEQDGGTINIFAIGQIYTQQAGTGSSTMIISNNDTSVSANRQTKISTQQLGSGEARTLINAASNTTNTNRGQLGIINEEGSSFIMQLGTAVTTSDYSMSIYNTLGIENIRLNTNGDTFFTGGNVGIGNTIPTEKLHVTGNTIVTGNITSNSFVKSGGIATEILAANGSVITAGSNISISSGVISTTGLVPTSRTITINGTTQDLSANRTYSVGTVTSVNASVPTGFAVGSAVTTSGNIAISFAAGYALPTTASQTNWDAAYNDKINSASVTGTTTKTLTLNQQDGGTITASWTDINTDAVASVFGRTGAVVATSGDYNTSQVTEVTNLYYTEARVNANANVAANTAARHNAVTLGTANGLTLSTQQLSLGLASGSTNGALSSTDWTTFNNKQNALNGTGFVKISGTTISYDNSTYYLASNPNGYTSNTGTVTSVAGTGSVSGLTLTGSVTSSGSLTLGGTLTLTSSNVTTALGFTPYNASNPNGYTSNTGTVTSVSGTGSVSGLTLSGSVTSSGSLTLAGTLTLTSLDITTGLGFTPYSASNPNGYTSNTGTVTSIGLSSSTSGVTIGSSPITTSGTITLAIATASGSQNGLLSSTDWTTFNNKQSTLTNPVTGNGAGAIGYFPIFSGVNSIENSSFFQSGTGLYFGGGSAAEYSLQIGHGRSGNGYAYIDLVGDTTYADYGIRLIRGNTGENSTSTIEHRGTGDFIFKGVDASSIKFQTGSTDRMIVDSAGRVGIGISPSYTLQVQGSGYFSDNVRFPNNKGLLFENDSTSAIGSIKMSFGVTNPLEITNGTNTITLVTIGTAISSNLLVGAFNIGTSATNTLVLATGTAPTTSPIDVVQMYSADIVANNAAPHFRTENGAVIKLYQETTSVGNSIFSQGGGTSVLDDSTFDGYTLRQIVKALRNLGILQ